jgi:ABC-type multidrug transport system ATPase subunit
MADLQIQHLTKQYGNVRALDDVTLTIGTGLFGLLGPNGAGKSSLMRTLATLQEPDSGKVFFSGTDIHREPFALRRQLGYLPQDFGVYPRFTAVELLDHLAVLKGIRSRADRREQVLALLERTNLYEVRNRAVSSYSGGMRQRFGVAQALLGDPKLVIVDEPTAGLDPEERNRFHDLLGEIGEKIVVLLSTHIVEDVSELCQDMAVLAQGRVILRGRPATLREQLAGTVWRKSVHREEAEHYRQSFAVLSERLREGKIQVHVLASERPESGFEPVAPGLEDVYFSALAGRRGGAA